MATKIHYELGVLLSEDERDTASRLQELGAYIDRTIIGPLRDATSSRMRVGFVQNQHVVNDFF